MTVIRIAALLFVFISAIAAQDCDVYFSQQQRSSWSSDTDTFALYDVLIQNNGASDISSLTVSSSSSFDSFWELLSVGGNSYELPAWRSATGGIPVDASHQFGYIIKGSSQADFSVVSCTAAEASADATPDAAEPPLAATSKPKHTTAPTEKPKHGSTEKPTTKHTDAPTHAPTSKPTTKPAATKAPATTKPTKAPATTKPTKAPATTKPTTAPSTSGSSSSTTTAPSAGGNVCGANSWWAPGPGTTWQWQLTGTIDTSFDVQMYDIDLFDSPTATIAELHSQGRVVICYFSTQYENWRSDSSDFTAAVLGKDLGDWAGEKYVDIRSDVVRNIMTARMDMAVTKGCDGLEPDNVDGYEADTGFPLTAADQIDFNTFIAEQAHARFLSVGLKNDVDQATTLQPYFDWALDEQCNQYDECDTLTPFIKAGKAVFECEYSGSAAKFCPTMNTMQFSSLLKGLDLTATVKAQCCTYATGGCVSAAHTCVTAVLA